MSYFNQFKGEFFFLRLHFYARNVDMNTQIRQNWPGSRREESQLNFHKAEFIHLQASGILHCYQ